MVCILIGLKSMELWVVCSPVSLLIGHVLAVVRLIIVEVELAEIATIVTFAESPSILTVLLILIVSNLMILWFFVWVLWSSDSPHT